jgi:hypothetical protein
MLSPWLPTNRWEDGIKVIACERYEFGARLGRFSGFLLNLLVPKQGVSYVSSGAASR